MGLGSAGGPIRGVVCDRRIAHTGIGSTLVDRDAGQKAVAPAGAAVRRGCPANIRGTAVTKAADLEPGCDRLAEGKSIGLDLGPVLTGRVGYGSELSCVRE